MSQKSGFTLVAACALALAGVTGYAQQAPQAGQTTEQARPARPWRGMPGLNLTDAQRDEIAKLREEHRAATREDSQKLRVAKRQLRDEVFADNPDQNKIATLKSDIAQLSQQLEARRLDEQERFARILTPEQRKLMREHRELRQQRMRDGMRRELRRQGLRRQFRQWQ